MPKEASARMKKYLSWAVIAFVIFYLLTSPHGAARIVHGAWGDLTSWAHSLSSFVNSL